MKVLFVGDVHNHNYIFKDVQRLDQKYKFDEIIFVGDYVDDWNTTNTESLNTLNSLINLKDNEPDKYILLLGNHELSYLGQPCSGHMIANSELVTKCLKENMSLFKLYFNIQLGDRVYICTHAGITNPYINLELKYVSRTLDGALNSLELYKQNDLSHLKPCSFRRGGRDIYSSFIWADLEEHKELIELEEPQIKYQIMGHTPVQSVLNLKGVSKDYDFYFIDTHSTYQDDRPYGDKSYLIWNEDKFEIIY